MTRRNAPGRADARERVSARQRNQQGPVDVAGGDVTLHPVGIGSRLRREQYELHVARGEDIAQTPNEPGKKGSTEEEVVGSKTHPARPRRCGQWPVARPAWLGT